MIVDDGSCEYDCNLSINSNISGSICNQSNTAGVVISVQGGTGEYAYLWDDGWTSDVYLGLSGGIYSVVITDLNTGCSVAEDFNLSFQEMEISTSEEYVMGGCANVTVDVNGGTPPYIYEYSTLFQIDDNILEGVCPEENALIQVTDANGCVVSTTIDIMATPDWNVESTDANHTILIPGINLTFENSPLSTGSYLGVFYTNQFNELVCAGSVIWEGETTSIAAWGSEAGEDNGFELGEEFIWGMWDSNTGQIQYGHAEYIFDPISFTGQGNYMPNGLSGVSSVTTPAPVWNYDITDANHVIALTNLEIYIDSEALEYGDWLGVFYTDDDGTSGGTVMWTGDNIAMTAWIDDATTDEKDGFSKLESPLHGKFGIT